MTDQLLSAPKNAYEQRLAMLGEQGGIAFADQLPNIWAPAEQVSPALFEYSGATAAKLNPEPRVSGSVWFWLGWLFFVSGLVIFVMAFMATPDNGGYILPWLGNTLVWAMCLLGLYVTLGRRLAAHKERQEWLKRLIWDSGVARIEDRKEHARGYEPTARDSPSGRFVPGGHAPPPQPYGVSHEGAEQLVAEWMRYLGAQQVAVTRFSRDGGIDVAALHYIAQVKNYTGSVDVVSVRELAGVAYADGRKPLFFTSGTYASGAVTFAAQVNIALFVYDAVAGTLSPVGGRAQELMVSGL